MPIPFSPSTEQQAIIDAFLAGEDICVQAGAGCGKSASLALIADAQLRNLPVRRARFITFNKRNAVEVGETFAEYELTNAEASTAHSLAYRACVADPSLKHMVDHMRREFPPIKAELAMFDIPKVSRCLRADVDYNFDAQKYLRVDLPKLTLPFTAQRRYLTLARDTVTRFCQSADTEVGKQHVPYLGEMEPQLRPLVRDALAETAKLMWAELSSPTGRLKTGHAHYLKAWALTRPQVGAKGDVLLYDEAQDANPVLAEVVLAQRGRVQLVLVGDEFKSLYSFTGAVDAIAGFAAQDGVITLPLSESRRFGQQIADVANEVLDVLDPDHLNPMRLRGIGPAGGQVLTEYGPAESATADAVVCSTNGQVIEAVVEQIAAGRTVACTLDIDELVSLAHDVELVQTGRADDAKEPSMRRFRDLDVWTEWLEKPGADDALLHSNVQIVLRHGAPQLRQLADKVIDKPDEAEMTVSTIHKAKGGT
jgi:superfamily I DNA/RNA helicase